MKKILLSVFIALAIAVPTNAATYDASAKVTPVGQNLLTKSGISTTGIKFMVVSGAVDNSAYTSNKTINVSTNELTFAGNDNEVAAVVGNELGHIISGHASQGKVVSLLKTTANADVTTNGMAETLVTNYSNLKQEKEADIVAIDLMVKAGYNPLASIVVLTKQTGTYWQVLTGQPANAERAMNIYNYISYAYPEKIKAGYACNEYRTFQEYAKTQIDLRNGNKKLEKNNTKTQAKNQKNSASKIAKFKVRGGISGWDAAYELLNGASK